MSDVYEGLHEWIDPSEGALRGIVPGFYASDGRGNLKKNWRGQPTRLVAVDDAPDDPNDGAWHLEVAKKGDPIAKPGIPVQMEVKARGAASVST